MSDYPNNAMETWLYERGFEKANPFATTVADQEKEYLAEELFMPVNEYDRIKGVETLIVFAPRGVGKSALRVRLAAISLPQNEKADVLAVCCTDFEPLLVRYRTDGCLTEEAFAAYLLRQTAAILLDVFTTGSQDKAEEKHRSTLAEQVEPMERSLMAAFVRVHAPHVLTAQSYYQRFRQLEVTFKVDWTMFRTAVARQQLKTFLQVTSLAKNPTALLVADICDEPVSSASPITWLEQFEEIVGLLKSLGIHQLQFLIDRIDESPALAGDHEKQVDFLSPLLAYLNLLELPGLAFKFFLAQELRKIMGDRPSLRRDRLLDKAVTIQWDKEALKKLLDDRLQFFSEGRVPSLVALCGEQEGAEIEDEILKLSLGSPRRMLTAVQLLVRVHVQKESSAPFLTTAGWKKAREELLQVMPPIIGLRLHEGTAVVGGEVVKLSKNETKILQTLVDHGGYCLREELINSVWDASEGVSDYAVDQAISRLRNNKLGDSGTNPVYLLTTTGKERGFRLEHYDVLTNA